MIQTRSFSDFEIRPLDGDPQFRQCVDLQELVWGAGFGEGVPPTILRLVQEMGGVASGAFDAGGHLLGFVFGITGWVDGQPVHWSDMLAVHPDARGRGIGLALKRHQRERLLERGVALARWTYEPLEARNARLNLSRLGATSAEYRRDYYGEGVSRLHEGIGTDRLIVDWDLTGYRVEQRLRGEDPPPSPTALSGVQILNPPHIRSDMPDCEDAVQESDAARVAVAVPSDIQGLKEAAPEMARRWREVTRAAFEAFLPRGYRATEFIRDGAFGYYLLDR